MNERLARVCPCSASAPAPSRSARRFGASESRITRPRRHPSRPRRRSRRSKSGQLGLTGREHHPPSRRHRRTSAEQQHLARERGEVRNAPPPSASVTAKSQKTRFPRLMPPCRALVPASAVAQPTREPDASGDRRRQSPPAPTTPRRPLSHLPFWHFKVHHLQAEPPESRGSTTRHPDPSCSGRRFGPPPATATRYRRIEV